MNNTSVVQNILFKIPYFVYILAASGKEAVRFLSFCIPYA